MSDVTPIETPRHARGSGQAQIPGTEREEIEPLTELGDARRKIVAEILSLQQKQRDLDAEILELMHQHEAEVHRTEDGDLVYRFEDSDGDTRDIIVSRTEKEKLTVQKAKLD